MADVVSFTENYPNPEHALFPGPLWRAVIFDVEETGTSAAVISLSHAVIDATYLGNWHDELDKAILGEPLTPRMDWKLWADSHYTLRESPEAKASANWHIKHLKGLENRGGSYWPRLDKPFLDDGSKIDPQNIAVSIPGIKKLHTKYPHISIPVIGITAHALMQVHLTGSSHSLFGQVETARTRFPFLPKSLQSLPQFESLDVAGPVMFFVANLVEVRDDETLLELLTRVQENQKNLTKHATAPWNLVLEGIGPDAAKVFLETMRSQIYNWAPGMGEEGIAGASRFKNFEMIKWMNPRGVGFSPMCGYGGQAGDTMMMCIFGQRTTDEELKVIGDVMVKCCEYVGNEENWDKRVGGFREIVKGLPSEMSEGGFEEAVRRVVEDKAKESEVVEDKAKASEVVEENAKESEVVGNRAKESEIVEDKARRKR